MLNLVAGVPCWNDTPLSMIAIGQLNGDERVAFLAAISSHDAPGWFAAEDNRVHSTGSECQHSTTA
ncbi:hypothetical protein [Paraburkholderia sp. SG-MS1]|uniref:hypothetical protein n=1 Tax=Paraburkholderia sp. SG-MS1 TaxID=2023741 RepID=UPI001445D0AC|nr:hypothetical protein [Paraburkholderia sp. SG-MS1]